jgi:hypothetical protein
MPDRVAGWWWWLVAGAAGAIAVAGQLSTWPSPDVAWNLYAGREVLHGARIGVDILENTPPMIFWLEAPAIWLAGQLRFDLWLVWVGWLTGHPAAGTPRGLRPA